MKNLLRFPIVRFSIIILPLFILFGCSSNHSKLTKAQIKNNQSIQLLTGKYARDIEQYWGKDIILPKVKNYVQYRDNFQTRVHIDFVSGKLMIETVRPDYVETLHKATVQTLLMSEPDGIIGIDTEYNPTKVPFLYPKVIDHQGEVVRWQWRADKFAQYLVNNKIKQRTLKNGKLSHSVEFNLVADSVQNKSLQFMPAINKQSKAYRIDPKLILAIIEVESHFNPSAVSRNDAVGLMQVQPHTAGRDLYAKAGKKGEPSRAFLLNPDNNIMMGSAYLALIRDQYLVGIKHPQTLEYAMIASYNGGAGSVLRVFSSDKKKAVVQINKLTPKQFYAKLTGQHASVETRNYLKKVIGLMQK